MFAAFAGEFLRRIQAEYAAEGGFTGGVLRRRVSGSLQSASRSGMNRRSALDGSRNSTVLRSSPTQSDPNAAGDRQDTSVRDASSLRSMAR